MDCMQHTRRLCPSLSPGVCSDSWLLSQWCYLTTSLLLAPSPFAFNLSQHQGLYQWVGSLCQVTKASASASPLPMNIQGWFSLGLTGLISLQSKGLSRVFSNTTIWNHQFFNAQPSLWFNSHLHMTTGKLVALTIWIFVGKMISLFFNTLSRFVMAFLPRSKCLNFMAAVTVFSDFESESERSSVVSDSLRPHGLYSPWNSPGQNTGVGSLSLLQGIFPTQGLNPGLPHSRWILYQLSYEGSPFTDFRAPKNKICQFFHFFPFYLPWSDGTKCHGLSFFNVAFQASFHSPFTLNKRLFSSSSLSAMRMVSSAYLRLLIFLLAILIPACDSSKLTFSMMSVIYSAYNLNKQNDNIQPSHTPFPN